MSRRDAAITHRGASLWLAALRAAQHVAEANPALAVEFGQLLLRVWIIVGRTGIELDARQQQRQLQIVDVRRLLANILAGEIVAGLFENLHPGLRDRDADLILWIVDVALRIVFRHELAIPGDSRIVGELRIA